MTLPIALFLAVSPVVQPVSSATMRDGGTAVSVRTQGDLPTYPAGRYGTVVARYRVAVPFALADLSHQFGLDTEVWGQMDAGGSTSNLVQEGAVQLVPDGGTHAIMTHARYHYQVGRGQLVYNAAAFVGAADAGIARVGLFDEDDGYFFQRDSRGLGFVRRTSVSGAPVDSWSEVDAGVNPLAMNTYETRFAWGVLDRVTAYVNAQEVYSEQYTGALSTGATRTASLPLRVEATGAASIKHLGASVESEAGTDPTQIGFVASRTAGKSVTAAAGFVPILSIRLKAEVGGEHNHISATPTSITCAADGKRIRARLLLNATLTGASWGDVDPKSYVEMDESATAYSGGTAVCSFAVGDNSAAETQLEHVFGLSRRRLWVRAFGVSDVLTVIAKTVSGTTGVACSIEWGEVR